MPYGKEAKEELLKLVEGKCLRVLVYDQDKNALGTGKFEPLCYGPYIISKVLEKGAYELVDYEGNKLARSRNGLYLKQYFA